MPIIYVIQEVYISNVMHFSSDTFTTCVSDPMKFLLQMTNVNFLFFSLFLLKASQEYF